MQDCTALPCQHDRGVAALPHRLAGLLHTHYYVQHSHSAATHHQEHVSARWRCVCQGTQYTYNKKRYTNFII